MPTTAGRSRGVRELVTALVELIAQLAELLHLVIAGLVVLRVALLPRDVLVVSRIGARLVLARADLVLDLGQLVELAVEAAFTAARSERECDDDDAEVPHAGTMLDAHP